MITHRDYHCTACGKRMGSYSEFEEYQHDGCGGLVELSPDGARARAEWSRPSSHLAPGPHIEEHW